MELYLNMGYYTIQISPKSKYMTIIVTKSGKFRYNWLTMVICTSGGIFQDKVEDIINSIKGVNTYINNTLVIMN